MPKKNIGVLAFQGGIIEHLQIIKSVGHNGIEVRSIKNLNLCHSLIIPGGESTTIGFFLKDTGLIEEIRKRAKDKKNPMPILGTCAGAIVLAKKITGKKIPPSLELLDIEIERNAYGTQSESFYAELNIPHLKISKLKAAFIRAPIIKKISADVQILAKHHNEIVLVKHGNIIAATFHPELVGEQELHRRFLCS